MICIGGRMPDGGDSERFEDFWPEAVARPPAVAQLTLGIERSDLVRLSTPGT